MTFKGFLILVAAMSAVTLLLYLIDKSRAKRGAWRIPEKVLLGCGILGGAAGGLLGMKLFRHKTKKAYFWTVNGIAFIVHVVVAVWLATKGI